MLGEISCINANIVSRCKGKNGKMSCINANVVDNFLTLGKKYIYRPRSPSPCASR